MKECGGKRIVDECGVCGGPGIRWDLGECDCEQRVFDCFGVCAGPDCEDHCGVCGGQGVPEGSCDCWGGVEDCNGVCRGTDKKDDCGICGGAGVDWVHNECDCDGNTLDVCGTCGGEGVPAGWLDCTTPADASTGHELVSDDEFKKRVEENKGQYEDTLVRATLIWNNCNDLDLWVVEPDRTQVNWN